MSVDLTGKTRADDVLVILEELSRRKQDHSWINDDDGWYKLCDARDALWELWRCMAYETN